MPLEPTNEEAVTPPTPLSPEEESFQSGERLALADMAERGMLDAYIESNNYAQRSEQELQDKWTTAESGSLRREDLYSEEGFQSANLDDRMGMLDRLSEHNESQYSDDRSVWDKHLYKTVFPDSVHPSDAWEGRSKGQLTIDKAVVSSGHNRDFGHSFFRDEHGASYDAWIAFEESEKGEGDVAALNEQLDMARGSLESKSDKMLEWMQYADFAARQLEKSRLVDTGDDSVDLWDILRRDARKLHQYGPGRLFIDGAEVESDAINASKLTGSDIVLDNFGDFIDGIISEFPGGLSNSEVRRSAFGWANATKTKMMDRMMSYQGLRGQAMSKAGAEHLAETLIEDAELIRGRFNGDFAITSTGQLAAGEGMYLLNDEDMMAKVEAFTTSENSVRVGDAADVWLASAREQGDIMAKAIYEQALVSDPEEASEMLWLVKKGKFDMEKGDHRRAVAAWVKANGGFSKAGLKFSASVQSMWGSIAMGTGDITGSEGVKDYAKREIQASQDKNSLASHMSGSEFWTDVAGAVPSLITSIVPGAIVGKLGAMFRVSKAGKGLGLAAKGSGRSARATVVGSAAFESGIKTYGDARLAGKSPGEASELAGYAALGTALMTRLGIKYGPEALVTTAALKGLTAKKLLSTGIFKEFLKLRGGQFYSATGALLKHGGSEWLEEAGDQLISGMTVETRLNPGVTWGDLLKQSVHAGNIGFALGAGVPTLRGEPIKDFISYGKSFQNMRRKALIDAALADGEVKISVDGAIQALTDSHSPITAAALAAGGKQAELVGQQRAQVAEKVRSDMEQEEDPKRSIMTRIGEALAGRNKEDSSPALVKQRARVVASYEAFERAHEAYKKNPTPEGRAILQAADANVTIQNELATELVDKVTGATPASKAKVGDTQTSAKPGSVPASTPSGEVPSATPSSPKGKPNRQAPTKSRKKDKFTRPTELAPEKEARWQKIAASIGFNSSEATRKDFGDAMNAVRKRARLAKSDAEFTDALADLDVLIEKQEARAVFHNAGHKGSKPGLAIVIQDEANKLKKAREIIVNRRKKTHKKPLPTAPKKKTQPAPAPKAPNLQPNPNNEPKISYENAIARLKAKGLDVKTMTREEFARSMAQHGFTLDSTQLRKSAGLRDQFSRIGSPDSANKVRSLIAGLKSLLSSIKSGNIKIKGVKYGDLTAAWVQYIINDNTRDSSGKKRSIETHKAYLTLTDSATSSLTVAQIKGFLSALADSGFNGQMKHSAHASGMVFFSDQFVMHGATKADAALAAQVASQFFGNSVSSIVTGVDPSWSSYSEAIVAMENISAFGFHTIVPPGGEVKAWRAKIEKAIKNGELEGTFSNNIFTATGVLNTATGEMSRKGSDTTTAAPKKKTQSAPASEKTEKVNSLLLPTEFDTIDHTELSAQGLKDEIARAERDVIRKEGTMAGATAKLALESLKNEQQRRLASPKATPAPTAPTQTSQPKSDSPTTPTPKLAPLPASERRSLFDRADDAASKDSNPFTEVNVQLLKDRHQRLREDLIEAENEGDSAEVHAITQDLIQIENSLRTIVGDPLVDTSPVVTKEDQAKSDAYYAKRVKEIQAKLDAGSPITVIDRSDWLTAGQSPFVLPSALDDTSDAPTSTEAPTGENIISTGSPFAQQLTNPKNNVGFTYKGKEYVNSEHAYQTWKSGEFNQAGYDAQGGKVRGGKLGDTQSIMTDIITEKLRQNPHLVKGIDERGGMAYLESSTHEGFGDAFWEGKNGGFMTSLRAAYAAYKSNLKKAQPLISELEEKGSIDLPSAEDTFRAAATQPTTTPRENLSSRLEEAKRILFGDTTVTADDLAALVKMIAPGVPLVRVEISEKARRAEMVPLIDKKTGKSVGFILRVNPEMTSKMKARFNLGDNPTVEEQAVVAAHLLLILDEEIRHQGVLEDFTPDELAEFAEEILSDSKSFKTVKEYFGKDVRQRKGEADVEYHRRIVAEFTNIVGQRITTGSSTVDIANTLKGMSQKARNFVKVYLGKLRDALKALDNTSYTPSIDKKIARIEKFLHDTYDYKPLKRKSPPKQKVVEAVADKELTSSEKQEAAGLLGEKSWTDKTRKKFAESLADWIVYGQETSAKLVSFFKRVIGNVALLATAVVSFNSANFTTDTSIDVGKVALDEGTTFYNIEPEPVGGLVLPPVDDSGADLTTDSPQRVRVVDSLFIADEASRSSSALPVNAPITPEHSATDTPVVKGADFGSVVPSKDVQVFSDWVVHNKDAKGKSFVVADKVNGSMYLFSKDGVLIRQFNALFGKTTGDVIPGPSKRAGVSRVSLQKTPAGRFGNVETVASTDPLYAPAWIDFIQLGPHWKVAIHKVWNGMPAQKRSNRLKSKTPLDNRISGGCINIDESVLVDDMIPAFEGGGVVYVLPESEAGVKSFSGFEETVGKEAKGHPGSPLNTPSTRATSLTSVIDGVFEKLGIKPPFRVVDSVDPDIAGMEFSLKNRLNQLKINKETHPGATAWLAKNESKVDWSKVKTIEQLEAFVSKRFDERSKASNFVHRPEETRHIEEQHIAALRRNAANGDEEAQRGLAAYGSDQWGKVLSSMVNPPRLDSAEEWLTYLTEGNDVYAGDVFLQDVLWDIPYAALTSDAAYGLGNTVNLNHGLLAQLAEKLTEGAQVNVSKAYEKLSVALAKNQAADRVATTGEKQWVLIPSYKNDPSNFKANVQKLKDLSCHGWCTKTFNAEPYLSEGDFWVLIDGDRTVGTIRMIGDEIGEIKDASNTEVQSSDHPYANDISRLLYARNLDSGDRAVNLTNDPDLLREMALKNPERVLANPYTPVDAVLSILEKESGTGNLVDAFFQNERNTISDKALQHPNIPRSLLDEIMGRLLELPAFAFVNIGDGVGNRGDAHWENVSKYQPRTITFKMMMLHHSFPDVDFSPLVGRILESDDPLSMPVSDLMNHLIRHESLTSSESEALFEKTMSSYSQAVGYSSKSAIERSIKNYVFSAHVAPEDKMSVALSMVDRLYVVDDATHPFGALHGSTSTAAGRSSYLFRFVSAAPSPEAAASFVWEYKKQEVASSGLTGNEAAHIMMMGVQDLAVQDHVEFDPYGEDGPSYTYTGATEYINLVLSSNEFTASEKLFALENFLHMAPYDEDFGMLGEIDLVDQILKYSTEANLPLDHQFVNLAPRRQTSYTTFTMGSMLEKLFIHVNILKTDLSDFSRVYHHIKQKAASDPSHMASLASKVLGENSSLRVALEKPLFDEVYLDVAEAIQWLPDDRVANFYSAWGIYGLMSDQAALTPNQLMRIVDVTAPINVQAFYDTLENKYIADDSLRPMFEKAKNRLLEEGADHEHSILINDDLPFSRTHNSVEGYYDPRADEMVFNASAIDSDARASELAFHEVTHRNIHLLAKDAKGRAELARIAEYAKPLLMEHLDDLLAATGHTTLADLKSDYGFDGKEGDVAVTYELLARYAENLEGDNPSWFSTLLSKLRLWLNKNLGLSLSEKSLLHWLKNDAMEASRNAPVAGTPLQTKSTSSSDPVTEAMLTLNQANEFLRASGRKHLDESEGMFEVDPDTFELSLRVPDVFITDERENRDQAGAELPALADIKAAITTLNESGKLRDAVLTIQQWEDEAAEDFKQNKLDERSYSFQTDLRDQLRSRTQVVSDLISDLASNPAIEGRDSRLRKDLLNKASSYLKKNSDIDSIDRLSLSDPVRRDSVILEFLYREQDELTAATRNNSFRLTEMDALRSSSSINKFPFRSLSEVSLFLNDTEDTSNDPDQYWQMREDHREALSHLPSNLILARNTLVRFLRLSVSRPSRDHLNKFGQLLGVEGEAQRQWIKQQSTQAIQPLVNEWRRLGLSPNIGRSTRNHAPTHAILEMFDNDLPLKMVGYLLENNTTFLEVPVNERVAADMQGLRNHIMRKYEADDRATRDSKQAKTLSSSIFGRTASSKDTRFLDFRVQKEVDQSILEDFFKGEGVRADDLALVEKIDAVLAANRDNVADRKVAAILASTEGDETSRMELIKTIRNASSGLDPRIQNQHYNRHVSGRTDFGSSLILLQGKLGRNGSLTIDLVPPHLSEEDAALFNKTRSADVRYTLGARWASKALLAAGRGEINQDTISRIEQGDPLALRAETGEAIGPVVDGRATSQVTEALVPAFGQTSAPVQRLTTSIDPDFSAGSNTTFPDALPFPRRVAKRKVGATRPTDLQKTWIESLVELLEANLAHVDSLTKADGVTPLGRSIHPVSQHAAELITLANNFLSSYAATQRVVATASDQEAKWAFERVGLIRSYNNLVSRVLNVSNMVAEMKKQSLNQKYFFGEELVDFAMLDLMESAMSDGSITNISPLALEQAIGSGVAVDTQFVQESLSSEGGRLEQTTNRDDAQKAETILEGFREYGFGHNTSEKQAAQTRAFMLASLFDLNIDAAKQWASQWRTEARLDRELFSLLDDAVDYAQDHEISESRLALATILSGSDSVIKVPDINNTRNEDAARSGLNTLFEHIMNLPDGKVVYSPFDSYFNRDANDGGVSTPADILSTAISQIYANVPVIIYDGAKLDKEALNYHTSLALLDSDGNVTAVLIDGSQSQFQTGWDSTVSQLVQHAFLRNGISTSTEMAVNAIKSDLDNYAAGLHLEATARAEAEAVVEFLQTSEKTKGVEGVDFLTKNAPELAQVEEHYQRQLELLAPEVAKVLGWGSRVTPGSFSDIDNVSFITQMLTDQRMQLLVDRMNAHNVVVSSATMETTPEAQELARRFMEGAYRPFTEGVDADASMLLTLDGNVGNGFQSIQTTETGEETDLDTVEDVNETTLPSGVTQGFLEQFGVTNYSRSVAESIISVAFDSLLETGALIPSEAVTSAIETYSGLTQTGGSKGDVDGGRTQSVLDFYDHHALSTIKKDRALKGRGAVWNNLVDEAGEKSDFTSQLSSGLSGEIRAQLLALNNAYPDLSQAPVDVLAEIKSLKNTLEAATISDKFDMLMPTSPVRPAAGPASELEGAAYISHARAAAERGGIFDSIMDRIRIASSLVLDHTEEHEALLREYPDMANAPQEVRTREARLVNRIAVETSIQHAAIEQLDGRGRDQFSDDIGRAAFVQKYEDRMWEAKKLRKRNLKNNQVSALPLGDEFMREAGAFLKEQQKDGTYAFLSRRVARVDPSTYTDPEAGSLNPDIVEGAPLQTASVTPSTTVDPAVLGTPISAYSAPGASPDVVAAAKDYQLVVRGRLYESDPIYAAAMDADPDGLGAQSLHGLIATATEIALNPSFSEEAQSSANFLLNELADGRVDFFTEEAGKLQGWIVSRWHIDEMVNGVDPKFKENFLLHQDAAVAALVPFDSISNRHAYMVFGEIDLGLRGNAGRAGWQREQKALVDELTRLANRAKPRAAAQAYAAALVASTSPDSSLTEREQIERTIATMREAAERNRGGGRKMSKMRRELRDQAGHADAMLNKAEAWLSKNEGMTEGVAEALDAHMLTGLEPSALKLITKARAFFKAMHPQLELLYRMQGKTIGNFDRYLPMRGFDLADEAGPETGLDGVELVHMSNAHTRTRFDQDQTRGLDFNPLRSILSGSNTTLYQLNTFAELDQASHVYGNEDTRESQMINVMQASDDLTTEEEGAVFVLNNALKERVRMQTTNDVSFNSHNGLFFKVLGKLGNVGYRVSLTSAAQVYLQTLPVAISYIMQNPIKGARLMENLTKMLATAPHSGANKLLGGKSEGMYLEHVANFIKYAAPEVYARSLDGVNELQDGLAKMNLNELDSVLDVVKAAPGAALKGLDKLHDLMLQMSTAAPDSLLIRALMATEYEMATGTRIDADTVTNLNPQAAVMARVESDGRMAQSDTSKKSEGFQPVKRKGWGGFALEVARRGFFVFGNHTMSLAAKQPAAWKMLLHPRSDAGMRKEGLKRITDFMMQVSFFNAMKIRNAAFIASYAFTAGDYDGDDELRRGMSPEELAKYNSKLMDDRDAAMEEFQKEWLKQYGEATFADAKEPLDRHDFFYSFAVKGGMELLGTVHPIASIPQLNGAVTGLLKSVISEHSEHQAPGYGADFYLDAIHNSLDWVGAPGYALSSVLKTEAAYRTATRDYEFDINDALLLGLTLGGPRENRSDALRSVQDENDSRVINKRHGVHSEVPKFYEALPHGMRGHEPMERPEGYEDIDFSALSEYAIDPNSISGDWERVIVSLAHRPWNDGDSLQTVRRWLDKRTFRLIDVDTLESSRNTPAMEGRTLEQAVSLGLTHDQTTGAGKRASYATQQLLTHADKIEILTLRESVVSSKRQYGHVIAHIDGKRIDVGAFLVANGHARVRPNAKRSAGGVFSSNRLKHLKKWQGDAIRDGRGFHKNRR